MSVDDAFRKLMQAPLPTVDPAPPPRQPAASEMPAVTEKSAVAEAMPSSPPSPSPLDLTRVLILPRLAYIPPFGRRSQIAEEYRILRTRLLAASLERPSALLTSCHHQEGKTTTALYLALALARQVGRKILLVDADLRRPRIHKLLGAPSQRPDIVSVLREECAPEEAIFFSREDNLYVLCGSGGGRGGADYLESCAMRRLLDRLHATFDFILLDASPCLSTSDAAVLGPFLGGVIMVVRSLQTQRESIEHAVATLRDVGVKVVGVVLTFVQYFLPRFFYRYQYYHGYYYERGDAAENQPPVSGR